MSTQERPSLHGSFQNNQKSTPQLKPQIEKVDFTVLHPQ